MTYWVHTTTVEYRLKNPTLDSRLLIAERLGCSFHVVPSACKPSVSHAVAPQQHRQLGCYPPGWPSRLDGDYRNLNCTATGKGQKKPNFAQLGHAPRAG